MTDPVQADDKGKPDDKGTPATPDPPAEDPKRLRSELKGLHEEAGRWKSEYEKLKARQDKIDAEAKKAAEAKAKEAGEFEKLLKERDDELATLRQEMSSQARKVVISEAMAKLGDVRAKNARERMAEKWADLEEKDRTEESWKVWVEQQKADDPDAFTAPATPTPSPSAGTPASPGSTGTSLAERLVAKDANGYPDLEAQSAAIEEARQRIARGEPIEI